MKKLMLIRDGLDLPFSVAPWGPAEPVLSGTFRPMTPPLVTAYRDALAAAKDKTAARCGGLAPHVLTWDAEGGPPDARSLAALPQAYLDALEMVVTGYAGSGAEESDLGKSTSPAA